MHKQLPLAHHVLIHGKETIRDSFIVFDIYMDWKAPGVSTTVLPVVKFRYVSLAVVTLHSPFLKMNMFPFISKNLTGHVP